MNTSSAAARQKLQKKILEDVGRSNYQALVVWVLVLSFNHPE